MRTKVTITTDSGLSPLLLHAFNVLMYSECHPTAERRNSDCWMFPTTEQAAEAVARLEELKKIVAEIRVATEAEPGVLDGVE